MHSILEYIGPKKDVVRLGMDDSWRPVVQIALVMLVWSMKPALLVGARKLRGYCAERWAEMSQALTSWRRSRENMSKRRLGP